MQSVHLNGHIRLCTHMDLFYINMHIYMFIFHISNFNWHTLIYGGTCISNHYGYHCLYSSIGIYLQLPSLSLYMYITHNSKPMLMLIHISYLFTNAYWAAVRYMYKSCVVWI